MLHSCYPVLATADLPAARAFWTGPMGFESVFDADWYVSLRRGRFELACSTGTIRRSRRRTAGSRPAGCW